MQYHHPRIVVFVKQDNAPLTAGLVFAHVVCPYAPPVGAEAPPDVQGRHDYVPRSQEEGDINVLYDGRHYDVLDLRIPEDQRVWWGRHARAPECDILANQNPTAVSHTRSCR